MTDKEKNSVLMLICHSFDDEAWNSPELSSGIYEHVDLRGLPGNERFNEASVLEWLKDREIDADRKWLGLGHYRRFLDLDGIQSLQKGKAYVSDEPQPASASRIWSLYHVPEYLESFLKRLEGASPALASELREWLDSPETTRFYPARNLFLARKADFMKWADFMRKCAVLAEQAAEDVKGMDFWKDRYQRRQPGFLMERLTAFWLMRKSGLELVPAKKKELRIFSPYQRELRSCVVVIQKDEANLGEWLRWHLGVCGFGEAAVFSNGDLFSVPDDLKDRVTQWKIADVPGQSSQFRAYNWFLESAGREFDVAMFLDSDEYLNLHGKTVEEYVWETGQIPVRAFNWVYYGSRTLGEWPAESFLKRFRHRGSKPNMHVKVMLDLRLVRALAGRGLRTFFANPHCLHCGAGIFPSVDVLGGQAASPHHRLDFDPSETPYVAHFYCRTKEEFERKIARGRPDCPRESQEQYFTEKKTPEMWEEFRRCDQNEVFDDEMARRTGGK